MNRQVELVIKSDAEHGECPCWHQEEKLLYWVDVKIGHLHVYKPETGKDRIINLNKQIGCVVPGKPGHVVVALEDGFYSIELKTEKLTFLAAPENHPSSHRFNDGKCDPEGRFLAGTMDNNEPAAENAGSLFSLDKNLKIKRLWDNLTIPNGIGWNPDYSKMYHIDSPRQTVYAFDYNLNTGNVSNRREVVKITDGFPDGMATDKEGMIWVAHWAGSKITRWNPETGQLLQSIDVPARNVTSCTFGGQSMDELYITTARKDMDEDGLKQYPDAGSVFRLKTDVIGIKNFEFAG